MKAIQTNSPCDMGFQTIHACLRFLGLLFLPCTLHVTGHGATSELKQPVALVWMDDTQSLWSATRHDKSILRIDVDSKHWERVFQTESPLTDLQAIPGTTTLAALQASPGKLYLFDTNRGGSTLKIDTVHISPHAEDLVGSTDGNRLYVLHRWNHLATILEKSPLEEVGEIPSYTIKRTIQLPFAPGKQILIPTTSEWVITAAFGGSMALLNPVSGMITSIAERTIHNIRDMVLSPDQQTLWLAHQTLHANATTLRGDIQWGFLMENNVSGFPTKDLSHQYETSDIIQLKGQLERPGNAAGDPEALLWTDRRELLVALAGVGEVAVLHPDTTEVHRLGVGRRPSAIAYDAKGRRAFLANTLSDSISVLKMDPTPHLSSTIRLGRLTELSQLAKGERLFFDAHQSFHGWYSCHSCHTDGHANGMLNDNEADGGFGAPKKVLTLLGVANTAPWSWLGKQDDLTRQVHRSIQTTMREIPSEEKADALRTYMETLSPAPPLKPNLSQKKTTQGMELFERLRCDACHVPPTFTDEDVYDVGVQDESGQTGFNPPSLLGVSQRTHFLHDGRARSLRSVFTKHRHMLKEDLSESELTVLLNFLESL